MDLKESITKMKNLKVQIAKLGEEKTGLQKEYDWLRFQEIPGLFEAEGVEKISIADIGTCYLKDEINVKTMDKAALYKWLGDFGHGGMITKTVHAGSLKAMLRELLKDGGELPGGDIAEIKPFTIAVIR